VIDCRPSEGGCGIGRLAGSSQSAPEIYWGFIGSVVLIAPSSV
jgi:hypothetical protein